MDHFVEMVCVICRDVWSFLLNAAIAQQNIQIGIHSKINLQKKIYCLYCACIRFFQTLCM